MADATIKQVMEFFEMGVAQFGKEWRLMTEEDKNQLKAGIGNGSLTY